MSLRKSYRWLVIGGVFATSVVFSGAPLLAQEPGLGGNTDESTVAVAINGTAGCTDHNSGAWHSLVKRDANGAIVCTYGHDHGMDPHQLDSVFGPLPLGQEISYPWQTMSEIGPENGPIIKHRMYRWIGAPNLACSQGDSVDGSSKMVTAFREEMHIDSNAGATVRFHSFWGQYRLTNCDNNDTGYLQVGGVMDFANLIVGSQNQHIPLANDPPANCVLNGDARHEDLLNEGDGAGSASVWYGSNSRASKDYSQPLCDADDPRNGPAVTVQVGVAASNYGPIDPNDPSALYIYSDFGHHDGTSMSTNGLTIWIGGFAPDATGHINFTGHTDRFGHVVPEVSGQPAGPDYIPLVIRNALLGAYGANGTEPGDDLDHYPVGYDNEVPGPSGQPGYYVEVPGQ